MFTHPETSEELSDLSAEILQLRNILRALEPEDVQKLGDGLRRLRQTLDTLDQRLVAGASAPSRMPSHLLRAAAETGFREAQGALSAAESVAARERCTQAILAYDKLLAMLPPAGAGP